MSVPHPAFPFQHTSRAKKPLKRREKKKKRKRKKKKSSPFTVVSTVSYASRPITLSTFHSATHLSSSRPCKNRIKCQKGHILAHKLMDVFAKGNQ